MKPRPFDYIRPDRVEEAIAVLAEHGEAARVLAGGQSLVAMLNLRLIEAAVLVDIARIAELDHISDLGDRIEVGAAVTQNRLLEWRGLAAKLPLLAASLPFVGHFQTRNKGTVCGSVAHGDPTAEISLALALLDGEVVLRSQTRSRVLAAHEFQRDMLSTACEPDELVTAVRFPVMSGCGIAFREVARRHGDFAIIAVGALIERDGGGPRMARLGIGGMTGAPVIARIALDGARALRDAVDDLAGKLEGYEDLHATARMRRDLLRRLAPVVIEEAVRCAA